MREGEFSVKATSDFEYRWSGLDGFFETSSNANA
jgi:hypothetical protein